MSLGSLAACHVELFPFLGVVVLSLEGAVLFVYMCMGSTASAEAMALPRPFPELERLEVLYATERRFYTSSPVQQLVEVTDAASAHQRRLQERELLFDYAQMPNPDRFPEGRPVDLPAECVWPNPDPGALLDWKRQAYNALEDFCRGPLTLAEVREAGCVHCNRSSTEVGLYRCVACRTSFVCWEHALFPACLEGLEVLVCTRHPRLTPGPGSWNPLGGWDAPGALGAGRGRGVRTGWENTALADISLRPDLEARRTMDPRTQLHLRRLEAAAGITTFNKEWRKLHAQARQLREQESQTREGQDRLATQSPFTGGRAPGGARPSWVADREAEGRDRVLLFHQAQAARDQAWEQDRQAVGGAAASSNAPAEVAPQTPPRRTRARTGPGDSVLARITGAMAGGPGGPPAAPRTQVLQGSRTDQHLFRLEEEQEARFPLPCGTEMQFEDRILSDLFHFREANRRTAATLQEDRMAANLGASFRRQPLGFLEEPPSLPCAQAPYEPEVPLARTPTPEAQAPELMPMHRFADCLADRLQAASVGNAEELPEELLRDLDLYHRRLRGEAASAPDTLYQSTSSAVILQAWRENAQTRIPGNLGGPLTITSSWAGRE
eukprot:2700212-Amphidinium_carterae.2